MSESHIADYTLQVDEQMNMYIQKNKLIDEWMNYSFSKINY